MTLGWLELIKSAFSFLTTQFGFVVLNEMEDTDGAFVVYERQCVRITVEYEKYSEECELWYDIIRGKREVCKITRYDINLDAGRPFGDVLRASDNAMLQKAMNTLAEDARRYAKGLLTLDATYIEALVAK